MAAEMPDVDLMDAFKKVLHDKTISDRDREKRLLELYASLAQKVKEAEVNYSRPYTTGCIQCCLASYM